MDHTFFKKLLDEYSSLKDQYTFKKCFSKVSTIYSEVIEKPYFDAGDFFAKEKIQKKNLFLDISKNISFEINEKMKADEYAKSLIITYLDTHQSFDFDLELLKKIFLNILNFDKHSGVVHCYVPIYGLESNVNVFELPCKLLTIKQITSSELDTITNLSILNSKHAVGKRFIFFF